MKDLTEGNEAKLLVGYATPMLLGNLFQQLYNTADSVVVGRIIGPEALGAVGASVSIIFLMVAMAMGITLGLSVIISQFYGAKDMDKVKAAVDTAYVFTFAAASLATVIGLLITKPLLLVLNTPPELIEQANIYLLIIFSGSLGVFGFNLVSAILRGLGDSTTPLIILIAMTLLNIVLDIYFVAVLRWGVAGAAWATVISQAISFVGAQIYLNRVSPVLKLDLRRIRFDFSIFKSSLRLGLPSGVQQMAVSVGAMLLLRVVNGFGAATVSAYSAAMRLETFAFLPALNIGMAVTGFTGQNIGAGKTERVARGFLAGLLLSGGISVLVGVGLAVFGSFLISVFTTDIQVIALGADYLRIVGPYFFIFAAMFVANGVLRGAGAAFLPLFSTLMALWIVRLPLAIFLSSILGARGIWWSIPAGWAGGAIIALVYYFSGRWKKLSLIKRAHPGGPRPPQGA